MEKFIKIEIINKKGEIFVKTKSENLTKHEIIGILTMALENLKYDIHTQVINNKQNDR